MQLILDIVAQPATQNEDRQAALFACYKDGSLLMDSRDNKKPARFFLSKNDSFPWATFIEKLVIAWQLSDMNDIPPQFRPKKRIPQFVIDGLPAETVENQLKILAALRKQGYFPALSERR